MINFKNQDDILSSVLILLSIFILAATLAYARFVPTPSVAGTVQGRDLSRKKLNQDITNAKALTEKAQAANTTRLWQGNPETVTAAVLAQLTNLTAKPNVKLGAFRPQRAVVHGEVSEMMFSVQVSGAYPDVQHVVRSLDRSGGKIVLRAVQIAATEGATNAVTATMGLSTFVIPKSTPLPQPTAAPVKASTGGKRG